MKTSEKTILIMSDLDGTYLSSESKPVARNLEAIKRFCANGGLFSFATGRVQSTIEAFVLPNFRKLINCPAIMCNGVCVYDPSTDAILFEERLDGSAVRSIVSRLLDRKCYQTNIYVGDAYTVHQDVPPEQIASDHWKKVVFYGEEKDIETGYRMIAREESRAYRFFCSSPNILEILPLSAGKGAMLDRLKNWYAARGTDVVTVAVGDYENDLDLLAHADISVCPANAMEKVKQTADYVFCDNDHGVIADIIEAIERGELV